MAKDSKAATLKRLNRIEGQVRGLARMVEDDRYCIDIVTQIGAVRAALRRVEEEVLREHVAHCVHHAIASGDNLALVSLDLGPPDSSASRSSGTCELMHSTEIWPMRLLASAGKIFSY